MLVVQFVATSAGGEKGIVLHDDRHANGGYRFETTESTLATGDGSFSY